MARAPKRGTVVFGYFFGPLRTELPSADDVARLTPDDAVLVTRFLDSAVESGAWPTFASTLDWQRDVWPMPEFFLDLMADFSGEYVVSLYSDDTRTPGWATWRRRSCEPGRSHSNPMSKRRATPSTPEDRRATSSTHSRSTSASPTPPTRRSQRLPAEGVRHFLLVPERAVDDVVRELRELGLGEVEVLDELAGGIAEVEVFQQRPVEELRDPPTRSRRC